MSYLPPLSDETKQTFDFFRACVSDAMLLDHAPADPNAKLAWARMKVGIDLANDLVHELAHPTGNTTEHPQHLNNQGYWAAHLALFNLWKELGFP